MIESKRIQVATPMPTDDRIGWCVSGVAWRQTDDGDISVWNRPFTVGKQYTRAEAEEYVLRELHKMWNVDVGWNLIVVSMPINLGAE